MTMEVQDFILSQKDYEKSINGQSSAALKQELLTLEVRRVVHQNKDPKVKAVISQQLEEDWERKLKTSTSQRWRRPLRQSRETTWPKSLKGQRFLWKKVRGSLISYN